MLMQSSLFFTSVAVLTGVLVSMSAYPVKGLSATSAHQQQQSTPLLEFRRQKPSTKAQLQV